MVEEAVKRVETEGQARSTWVHKATFAACVALVVAGGLFACLDQSSPLKKLDIRGKVIDPPVPDSQESSSANCALGGNPFPRDFWFVKTKKVGGSTLRSLFLNLDRNYRIQPIPPPGQRKGMPSAEVALQQKEMIKEQTNAAYYSLEEHIRYSLLLKDHLLSDPLLFTATRHPLARAYSHYFQAHQNICMGVPQDDANCWNDTTTAYLNFVKRTEDFVYHYVRGDVSNHDARDVLDQYDFVFVTERFDESLVLFKFKYNLNIQDIQYKVAEKLRTGEYPSAEDRPQWLNNATMSYFPTDLAIWELANKRLDDLRQKVVEECGEFMLELAEFELERAKG